MIAINRQTKAIIAVFSFLGFVFNFVWEYLQCAPFFRHAGESPTALSMVKASAGDVLMMVFVYLAISILNGSWKWISEDWSFRKIAIIGILSIIVAVLVELVGLNSARWTYTSRNPLIPGIGVSLLPIFQMLLINPVSFYISKKTVTAFRRYKQQTMEAL